MRVLVLESKNIFVLILLTLLPSLSTQRRYYHTRLGNVENPRV